MSELREREITIIGKESRLEGQITFHQITRVHGTLVGEIHSKPGSTLILEESSVTQGTVRADELIIEGFVKGQIHAESRVVVAPNGRVLGDIHCRSISISFGAQFDGQCKMDPPALGAESAS